MLSLRCRPFSWRRSSRFDGHLEGVSDGRVRGWVIDRLQPRARVAVGFGETAALGRVAIADRYRADVQSAGLSEDGYCGFAILPAAPRSRLYVRLSAGHRIVTVDLAPRRRKPRLVRLGTRLYAVDQAGDWVSGYALDLEDPQWRGSLELRRLDGSSAHIVACRFDARARPTSAHDGFHGFRAPRANGGRLVDATTGALLVAWKR